MFRLTAILAELAGLFVDDGSLVLATLAWIILCALGLRAGLLGSTTAAVLLALGIAVLLAGNVVRAARRRAQSHRPQPAQREPG